MSAAWWENPGDGSGDWISRVIGDTVYFADRFEVADFNGDSRPDIAVTEERFPEPEGANVWWFEQPGDAGTGSWIRHRIVTQNTSNNLDVADMDGDGDPDIITAEHRGTKKMHVWENIARSSQWREHLITTGHESHLGARTADLDHDGDLDIVSVAWDDYRYLHIWRNDASGHVSSGASSSKR